MDDLRSRFRRLVSIHTDALRHLEHRTFNRLLYRNRQQHRHGLYFRRLEHVRRLIRKISSHVVWNSVQHALGEEHDKVHSTRRTPLALSSVTVQDLQSVEAFLKVLVGLVIPATAIRVTTELICRQHFIPFAVAIVACLARIFVIERKLVAEVRGALVEAKLLLGISDDERGRQKQNTSKEGVGEDVGEEVESTTVGAHAVDGFGGEGENACVSIHSETTGKARIYEGPSTLIHPLKRQRLHADNANAEIIESGKPSLYDIMALYNKGAASVAASTRFAVGNPTTTSGCIVGGDDVNVPEGVARKKIQNEMPEAEHKKLVATVPQNGTQGGIQMIARNADASQPTRPRTSADIAKSSCQTTDSSSSSDSEDIDDIFGVLEN